MSKRAASVGGFDGFAFGSVAAKAAGAFTLTALFLSTGACKKNPETSAVDAGVVDAGPPPLAKVVESCDMISAHGTCVDYTKSDLAIHRTLCEGFKGKFAEAACNLDNTVGGCVLADGEIKRYYNGVASKDSGFTVEFAKKNCESDLLKGRFLEVKK